MEGCITQAPFAYYVEDHRKDGSRTPYIKTFKDVYVRPGNTTTQTQFENMQKLATEYIKNNLLPSAEPDTPINNLPALPTQAEIDIYGKSIGIRKGKEVRGLERPAVRDLGRAPTSASQHTVEDQQEISELRVENAELKKRLEANEAATQAIQDKMDFFMSQMGIQQRCQPSTTPQPRDDDPERGNGNSPRGSVDPSVDITVP